MASDGMIDLENPEFNKVLTLLDKTNHSIFLTGKAGTGKSTFLRFITRQTDKKFVVLAPTGIAAVNVGGQTIHSFFHLPFKPLLPDDPDFANPRRMFSVLGISQQRLNLIRQLELIIIDEISMVRADIIDFIDKLLRFATGDRRRPFGGKQLLLVGDIFQLEPVVTADIKDILGMAYAGPYFFNANVFNEINLVSVELVKVYRQTDRNFVEMLDRIRMGSPSSADMLTINSRLISSDSSDDDGKNNFSMTIATRRDMVDNINQSKLDAISAPARTYIGETTGDFPESSFPTDLKLVLKEGAQVVFVKNDAGPVRRWVNGTLGRVVEAFDDKISVELENGDIHVIDRERWSNIRYKWDKKSKRVIEEEIGSFTQYPLKLAWALTIHKSQGLTFRRVNIDVGRGAFTGGQSYVALSRCTSLEGIRMKSTLNERDIFVNPSVKQFSRTYNDNQAFDAAVASAQADMFYRDAEAAFQACDYALATRLLCQATSYRNDLTNPSIARLLARRLQHFADAAEQRNSNLLLEIAQKDMKLREIADEYFDKAEIFRTKKWDPENAIIQYDKALSIYSEHLEAMLAKAECLFSMSDADGAIALLDKMTRQFPDDYRAPYQLGRFFLSCSDYSNALDRLLLAVERNGNIPQVHDDLASLYQAVDDQKSARSHQKFAAKLRSKRSK